MRYIVSITPAMAQELIDKNPERLSELGLSQRRINPSSVRQYEQQILSGQWAGMIDPIHLAKNGAVINGQHRLLAVKQANVAIVNDVVKNTPPEWFSKFDTGHRTTKDALDISNEKDSPIKASLMPMIYAYFQGQLKTYHVTDVPVTESVRLAEEYRDEIEEAITFSKDAEFKRTFVAFMYFVLNRTEHLRKVKPFLEQFKDGTGTTKGCPAQRLRRKISYFGRNIRNKELLAKMFYVVNCIIEDKKVGQIRSDWSFKLSDGPVVKVKKKKSA